MMAMVYVWREHDNDNDDDNKRAAVFQLSGLTSGVNTKNFSVYA